ncbi:Aste57867_20351 [Aphanomyces stellatus]|uniref:Aste57867_20351 protein n=1 Tax=Aphanomyces stellatus TaxID=120398 RepID=A0A485LFH0_9STRA|nr:hypothetical protein As57867_020285 [Aphanomyces stellatus]VFT97038.1 Aste57867_20351 [Aphanomyces stellatus]
MSLTRTALLPLKSAVPRLVRKRAISQPLPSSTGAAIVSAALPILEGTSTSSSSAAVLLAACGLLSVTAASLHAQDCRNDVAAPSSSTTIMRYFDEDYDLVNARTLGQGAFGMVMQCVHKLDKTLSAVKVVSDGYDEAERERNALSCVEHAGGHPNIIHLDNYYTHDGFHYMVLEYVDGITLFDHVAQQKQLTQEEATAILAQVASALAFMHAQGMVHCDLKPDNIMVSVDDSSISVKIIDFGSATIPNPSAAGRIPLKRALTLSSAPLSGTKTYWSPEMLAGRAPIQVGPSMDMWSLGCLLFIMLSGRHPFDQRGNLSEAMILHNIVHAPVVFDHPVWASVAPELKDLVAHMLDKDPATRLSAAALVAKTRSHAQILYHRPTVVVDVLNFTAGLMAAVLSKEHRTAPMRGNYRWAQRCHGLCTMMWIAKTNRRSSSPSLVLETLNAATMSMNRIVPLTASVEVLSALATSVGIEEEGDERDDDEDDGGDKDGGGDGGDAVGMQLRLQGDGGDRDSVDKESEKKRYTVQEQRAVIRKIHESNQILKQELSIEWREAKTMMGAEKQAKLKRLQKQSSSFTQKIEVEKRTIQKLEETLAARHRELQHLRDENVKNDKLESAAAATRRVRALENRLEISLVKKNEVDSINKHLRQQIDKVRRDRIVFDGIYKKLERETYEFRSRLEIATTELAKSIAAKEHIDKEVQDLQALVESEQQSYEKEFKELRALIAASRREASEQARAIELAPEAEVVSGVLNSDQESSLHRTSALSSWKIAYDKALGSASNAEALRYHQLFERIFHETGIPDVDKLAQEIQRKDEDNFKKFKHVEGLNKETDELRIEIERTTAALDAYKLQEGIGTNVLDKANFRALTAKLTAIDEKNARFDAEYDESGVRLARIKATIHSLLSMLNQSSANDKSKKASSVRSVSLNDITEANMLEHLQVIEKCIISLLQQAQHGELTIAGNGPHVLAEATPHANAKRMKQCVEPPTLTLHELSQAPVKTIVRSARSAASTPNTHRHRADSGVEEDERALTYEELKESAQASFSETRSRHRGTRAVHIQTPPHSQGSF